MPDETKASVSPASSDASPTAEAAAESPTPAADQSDRPDVSAASAKIEAPANATPREPSARPARRVYQAGTMRKTLLSFVFLLLLPFFASLPAMLYQRITHQLWDDIIGFSIFAAAFAVVMLLVTFELVYSIRSRVELGEGAVRLILPAARGVAMPKLLYRKREIPYSEIDLVETRREIYGGSLAPVMLRGARVVTKSGEKIPLGYVSEANVDPVMPVPEIASEIARRAGLEVIDRGTVRRQVHKKLRGIKATDDAASPVTEAEIAALNRRHNNVMIALCSLLFVLVGGGLLLDLSKSDLDLGEFARGMVSFSWQAPKQ